MREAKCETAAAREPCPNIDGECQGWWCTDKDPTLCYLCYKRKRRMLLKEQRRAEKEREKKKVTS